jgi:thrombospondin type 3 repeat protein
MVPAAVGAIAVIAGGPASWAAPGGRGPAPPTQAEPKDDWTLHTSVGLDLGSGATITSYNQGNGDGGTLFFTGLRATYDLQRGFAALVGLRQWWLPGPNHATMYAFGARWEPFIHPIGRFFVDGMIGPTSTGYAWAFGFELGAGYEFALPDAPGLGIGPFLTYGNVINPDRRTNDDGRAWAIGASFTYHFGRAAAGASTAGATPERRRGSYRIGVPDTDRDGVTDDEDQCPAIPAGAHPDPFRPGCPENDEDGDGVPDVDDACPVTPPGPKPDPKRPGCPFIDTDGDGIPDADDACPIKAGPASPDPSRNGCPDPRHVPAAPAPPPPQATAGNQAPKPAKRRHLAPRSTSE